ncbi:MAG: hypothetical protein GXP28_01770 [Planctomycetes bacterium]|nr:hypothetical protein [Planctomycetota bacterium]
MNSAMNALVSRAFLLAWVIFVFCSLATAAEPLVWKFVEGDTYHYQMVQEMETTMNLGPGGATTSSVKQTIDMVWEINLVDDQGTAALTQTIDRVQMHITAPGQGEVHFDTASEEPAQGFAAMLAPSLKAATQSPFQVTMTSRGEITQVEVPEALIEILSQGPAGALLGSLATEKGFKETMASSLLVLPTFEELVEGHQWSTSLEIENPTLGNITTLATYEYQGSREVEGQTMEVFVPTRVTQFDGATLRVEGQKTTGEILFNRSAGHLDSTSIHQSIDLLITVDGNDVNQHLDQTIRFRMTKEK